MGIIIFIDHMFLAAFQQMTILSKIFSGWMPVPLSQTRYYSGLRTVPESIYLFSRTFYSVQYLLAMVYTYFKRAEIPKLEYNPMNFFVAL